MAAPCQQVSEDANGSPNLKAMLVTWRWQRRQGGKIFLSFVGAGFKLPRIWIGLVNLFEIGGSQGLGCLRIHEIK
jgi:hypothetical protein